MLLSDMQSKDIIDINIGKKIGTIIDVSLDKDGKVIEIMVQKRRFIFFSGGTTKIKWSQIDKFGKDVILVNGG